MQSATQSFAARSHDAVIRVYNEAGNVIETHGHGGDDLWEFAQDKEPPRR